MSGRALVTGGSGFIGTNLVQELLDRGFRVQNLDLSPPQNPLHREFWRKTDLCRGDLLSEAIREFGPRHVYHLAARTDLEEKERIEGYAANTDGAANLLRAIEAAGTVRRCIFSSSQLVCRIGYVPRDDTDYAPNTLYGESKAIGETIVRERDGGGTEWCIVRPTTIWGPWCPLRQLKFIDLIRKGRYFHVGRGMLRKSYGYVGNACRQLIALMEADGGRISRKTFYLADYEPLSLREWAEAFREEMGAPKIRTLPLLLARAVARVGDVATASGIKEVPLTTFRLNNMLTEYVFDMSGTRAVVPDLPFTMRDGVRRTLEWRRAATG